ncbi:MAG TPA: bifunctional precorrin-2 dehydrogenase/sirohydrochlorin ferrochelatase [Gemmatimonadaceae bacterium]|nr:bifunctional precorrin-2 dehydrogenase/sirohydrochlorin ferrochelatase [Gemmatimonadaceae bacterium]
MSGLPVLLRGDALRALVVGGGAIGTRYVRSLLEAGAEVRVVAPTVSAELQALAASSPRVTWISRQYAPADVGDAMLVLAATDQRAVNADVARDARAAGRWVVVADSPTEGTCSMPAVHRAGPLTIAVSAGGVPGAAARIRDALAGRFDGRYATVLRALGDTRRLMLSDGRRDAWRALAREALDERFCARVEDGTLATEVRAWH